MIRIRRARREDVPAVLGIEKQSFGARAWTKEQFLPYFDREKPPIFLLAIVQGVPAAYVLVVVRSGRAEVDSIAVAPLQRGRGLAARLLRKSLRQAADSGARAVFLSVRVDNHPAIRLYRKFGFRRVRRVENYYEDGAPALRMRAPMSPVHSGARFHNFGQVS